MADEEQPEQRSAPENPTVALVRERFPDDLLDVAEHRGETTLLLRPEIRYDHSLKGTHPFNGGRDNGAFTVAADAILGF